MMSHSIEAIAIDEHHLELKTKIPPGVGNRFFIHILTPSQEKQRQLQLLKKAYRSLSEIEISNEKKLSEEGLQIQPNPTLMIIGEEESGWWK